MNAIVAAAAVVEIDPRRIYHMPPTAAVPELRFEWHPVAGKLYMIRVDRLPLRGELIAAEIKGEGAAHMARLLFLRGWMAARIPDLHAALRGE